ncbi:phosphoenolpyruvate carboxylase [Salvia divinorum]|uniref:Protein SCAR n=1 Tax=Salvia divinorum TaxID=28513 RepID=A0ABD1I1N6_SALDI
MPLLRAEVRNEYALGAPDLYREANKEEPKEILEGVAVAGLVGVLRQLGDLAEFAAEVFHGLQEEVTNTTARSHKLMARVRRVESALSPLEKALLSQRSHLHFAYTSGSNWHTRIRCEQNHFIYSDVPQFITESYEDCRHPPCLHMLDRFDAGGPGSCLKRYSDPTFFKRASVTSGEASIEKTSKEKKGRKAKKRRSRPRNEEMSRDASFSYNNHRTPFTQQSVGGGHVSPTQTASTYDDTMIRSDLGEQSNLDLSNGPGYIEGDFRPSYSVEPESRDSISSAVKRHENDFLDYSFLEEKVTDVYDAIEVGTQEQPGCSSSSITWEEKRESFEPTLQELNIDGSVQEYNHNRQLESFSLNLDMETLGDKCLDFEIVDQMIDQSCNKADGEANAESGIVHLDDIESETDNFMDALNTIESESETDLDSTRKQVADHQSEMEKREGDDECELKRHDLECQSSFPESDVMASSPSSNGNYIPHGHSLIPMHQKSSYATDFIDDASPEDDLNSVSLMDKDLESSRRSGGSATPVRPKSNDAHDNDNIDAGNYNEFVPSTVSSNYGRPAPIIDETTKNLKSQNHGRFEHNLECQSSSPGSNAVANSPLTNGSCGNTLIPTSQKSLHTTDCVDRESSRQDDVNSISEMNKSSQSSQRSEDAPSSGHPKSSVSHENGIVGAGMYVESVSSTVSSNLRDGRPRPVTEGTRKSSKSHEHVPEISNATPVSFWTNGGLLGLRPSKPPDCSVQNALPQDPGYKKDGNNNSSIQHFILSDNSSKPDQLETSRSIEEDLEMDISSHEYHESGMNFRKASWKISPADLEINLGKLGDSLYQHNANSTGTSVPAPGLSNRLLTNGSNQKSLPCGSGNTYSAGSKNANDFELKNCRSVENDMFSGRSKELFGGKSPILSPSSSPPLEHMKISFQPINGFESSKLKLKFPDGKNINGSGSDIYPSFQLVPEVSIPRYNVGSDSDADTFYRSSPSLSDDCQSNQSESNSEQWESSESPISKDRDLYDALRRISLTESVSEDGKGNQENIPANLGVQFPFIDNGVQKSESCSSFDLQSSTINNSFRKERIGTNPKYLVEPQFLPSSALPPLPPFQWRGTTSIDDKSDAMPEGSYYALDLTRSASTISQPKPAPLSEDQIDPSNLQKSKLSSQKSNGQRPTNHDKNTDENDFLHQIRTKSFSLRPTMTARSIAPSGAPATVQVNAILEKANAIRQAVASDAEDDGTWSDT